MEPFDQQEFELLSSPFPQTSPSQFLDPRGPPTPSILDQATTALETAQQVLKELQALDSKPFLEIPPLEPETGISRIDPLCTQRQRSLAWYKQKFGVIGLVWYIGTIAEWEVADERSVTPRIARPKQSSPLDAAFDPSILSDDELSESETTNIEDVEPSNATETQLDHASTTQSKTSSTWDLILNDIRHNNSETIIYYLSSLHDDLLDALIAGNLPTRMQDETFNDRISPHTQLQDSQGVYAIYVAIGRQPVQSTQDLNQSSSVVGKSLTLEEMRRVCNTVRLYVQTDHPMSRRIAKIIDKRRTGASRLRKTLDYTYQRRYGSGTENDDFSLHTAWLDFVDAHYLDWAEQQVKIGQPELLRQRLERCFVYVGLASSVSARAPNHWKHIQGTSPVFGLFVAVLDYHFPGVFTLQPHTYQIFRTVDRSHIGLDEKLATVLLSGYIWDGGLSAALAGRSRGIGARDQSHEKTLQLEQNRKFNKDFGFHDHHIRKSVALMKQFGDALRPIESSQLQTEDISQRINALYSHLAETIDDASNLISRIRNQEKVELERIAHHEACDAVLAAIQEYEDADDI